MISSPFSLLLCVFFGLLVFSDASPTPTKADVEARTPVPARVVRRSGPAGLEGIDVEDEPRTPTGHPIIPEVAPLRRGSGAYGDIRCSGKRPTFDYPWPFTYASFFSTQHLCASRAHGGNPQGNLGGYCDNFNRVKFAENNAYYGLYHMENFQLWCLAVCICPLDRRQTPDMYIRRGHRAEVSETIHLGAQNYELVLYYGPIASPTSSSTVLPSATATPTVTRQLRFTPTSTPRGGGDGGAGSSGAGGQGGDFNDHDDDPMEGRDCQTNSDCATTSSGGTCSLDDKGATTRSPARGCSGVCQVTEGSWKLGQDPVFYPGKCIAAITITALSLFGRDLKSRADVGEGTITVVGNVTFGSGGIRNDTLPPSLAGVNLTSLHCGCNTSWVGKDCCSYPYGIVEKNTTARLGYVGEVASA
ncbi:MAG: hypothetical protein M1814_005642 [Vezdaea aestivalis]|nr:MAG: hypothetical protein M1814_005642 [Vezdaea aestivalis]